MPLSIQRLQLWELRNKTCRETCSLQSKYGVGWFGGEFRNYIYIYILHTFVFDYLFKKIWIHSKYLNRFSYIWLNIYDVGYEIKIVVACLCLISKYLLLGSFFFSWIRFFFLLVGCWWVYRLLLSPFFNSKFFIFSPFSHQRSEKITGSYQFYVSLLHEHVYIYSDSSCLHQLDFYISSFFILVS